MKNHSKRSSRAGKSTEIEDPATTASSSDDEGPSDNIPGSEPLVYETQDWTDNQREKFQRLLKWSEVNFTWENDGALSIDMRDEVTVDALLDQFTETEIAEPEIEEYEAEWDDDNDYEDTEYDEEIGDDKSTISSESPEDIKSNKRTNKSRADTTRALATNDYEEVNEGGIDKSFACLTRLYEAAEALSRNSISATNRLDFISASDEIAQLAPPFGWEKSVWDYVQDRTGLLADAIESDLSTEIIKLDARNLREITLLYM